MTRRRGFAIGIGITMAAAYTAGVIGFFQVAPALLRASSVPESQVSTQTGHGYRLALLVTAVAATVIAALQLAFMIQAGRSRRLSGAKRALWVAALLFGSVAVMPFFWYLRIWRPAVLAAAGALTDEERFAGFVRRRSAIGSP